MPSINTTFFALTIILPLLFVAFIIWAFFAGKKEKSAVMHIRILRRSIGATFILALIIIGAPKSKDEVIRSWDYAGPLLLFISAIHYGYARKAEKAAIALEQMK